MINIDHDILSVILSGLFLFAVLFHILFNRG